MHGGKPYLVTVLLAIQYPLSSGRQYQFLRACLHWSSWMPITRLVYFRADSVAHRSCMLSLLASCVCLSSHVLPITSYPGSEAGKRYGTTRKGSRRYEAAGKHRPLYLSAPPTYDELAESMLVSRFPINRWYQPFCRPEAHMLTVSMRLLCMLCTTQEDLSRQCYFFPNFSEASSTCEAEMPSECQC